MKVLSGRLADVISFRTPMKELAEREVGGKAWNLFRLRRYGFPAPPWCVVSSRVLERTLRPRRGELDALLGRIDFEDPEAVEETAAEIGRGLSGVPLDPLFRQELARELEAAFARDALFAVRSSVVGEDSASHSFAGQMDSLLNVSRAGILDAMRKVWASAFSARALRYRRLKGLSLTDISMGVILQEFVPAAVSGVLFTRDPERPGAHMVASAGRGLGEGVVSGLVEVDTYRLPWRSNAVAKEVRAKSRAVVPDGLGSSRTRADAVDGEIGSRPALTDAQALLLRDAGAKAEKRFGGPQDVEWAFDRRGRLFILQSRPIILDGRQAPAPAVNIWDNSNIVESYPGLTLPLTFSVVRSGYEKALRNAALGFVLFKPQVQDVLPIFKNMIGLLHGRVYYNLLHWYEMLSYLPGWSKRKRSWDQMVGISKTVSFPQSRHSPANHLYGACMMAWRLLRVRATARRFFARFDGAYGRLKDMDLRAADEIRLIRIYESLDGDIGDYWHLTLYNDFCALTYHGWLRALCARWGPTERPGLDLELLRADGELESVAPVRSLLRMAELFRRPAYEPLLREDDRTIWDRIKSDDGYKPLREALELHLRDFGDRGPEELKFEAPTFREEPAALIGLIKSRCRSGAEFPAAQPRQRRLDAEAAMNRRLSDPFKRLAFRFVLWNARAAVAYRESMRLSRTRLYGFLRRLLRRMGELFHAKGVIESASDIFYLTIEEIFGLVRATGATQDLKALVNLRKEEYAEFSRRRPEDRFQTSGIPCLHPLGGLEPPDGRAKGLSGLGCSSGVATGIAKVVREPREAEATRRDILVAVSTDPGWAFLMASAGGMIVERGSLLSHSAIIGRELGIPMVVAAAGAARLIPDGAEVTIDGSTGDIRWR